MTHLYSVVLWIKNVNSLINLLCLPSGFRLQVDFDIWLNIIYLHLINDRFATSKRVAMWVVWVEKSVISHGRVISGPSCSFSNVAKQNAIYLIALNDIFETSSYIVWISWLWIAQMYSPVSFQIKTNGPNEGRGFFKILASCRPRWSFSTSYIHRMSTFMEHNNWKKSL
jgi:hypothetical protein